MTPTKEPTAVKSPSISAENYAYMQQYIYQRSGILLDSGKHYLLESRLVPILRQSQLENLDALCARLKVERNTPLPQLVIDAMTTNETLFFRDPNLFEALRSELLLPMLQRVKGKRKLRIWSAASSSGQEAYSLAILLLEMGHKAADVEIVGSDLSEKMVARAREGKYVQFEVSRGLPTPHLLRYFVREGLDWRLKDDVRSMARFETFDLRMDMRRFGTFDLILCRNVLIYFDLETRNVIFDSFEKALQPGGALLLGCAESMNTLRGNYERKQKDHTTYYQIREA